jgi:hypothetical protein
MAEAGRQGDTPLFVNSRTNNENKTPMILINERKLTGTKNRKRITKKGATGINIKNFNFLTRHNLRDKS